MSSLMMTLNWLHAALTPKFKLDWIYHESEKTNVTTMLENRVAPTSSSRYIAIDFEASLVIYGKCIYAANEEVENPNPQP